MPGKSRNNIQEEKEKPIFAIFGPFIFNGKQKR